MDLNRFYGNIKSRLLTIVKDKRLASHPVRIVSEKNYELAKGEETMVKAFIGENNSGTIYSPIKVNKTLKVIDAVNLTLDNTTNRTIFFSVLNAIFDLAGLEPDYSRVDEVQATKEMIEFLKSFKKNKLLIVGYEENIIKSLKEVFELRVLDLDERYHRKLLNGKKIYHPELDDLEIFLNWCDFMFVSGSTIVNGTFNNYFRPGKSTIFYGTSAIAAAHIMKLQHFVPSKALLIHDKSDSLEKENCEKFRININGKTELIKINKDILAKVELIAQKQQKSISEIINHLLYNFVSYHK